MATINRINGIVSGFDTESLVKDLMKIEQSKMDRIKQNKQLEVWKKDAYKDFSSLLRGLQSEFMDVLKPSTNLTSRTMFNVYEASVTLDDATNAFVTAKTTSYSQKGSISIDEISQLATQDTWSSGSEVKSLQGSAITTPLLDIGSGSINVTLNGITKEITLTGSYASFNDLVVDLQGELDGSFGAGNITVGGTDVASGLNLTAPGSSVTLTESTAGALTTLGFTSGDSNVLSTGSTLETAFGIVSDPVFTINGVTSSTMGIKSTDTIKQMMDKINSSAAGVSMTYSTISNKFVMKSTKEGVANNIVLDGNPGFFSDQLKLSTAAGRVSAQDAMLNLNGVDIMRSSNTFDVDGTTLTLKQTYTPAVPATASDITINVTGSATSAVATIKSFVEKYNELIAKINTAVGEKHNREYLPLTEEQRESMDEKTIELWETKAKSGLLRSDSLLRGIAEKLRATIWEPVAGLNISLQDIGITTSSSYTDNGKLVIDETKLTAALTERPNEVIDLFTKESETTYSDEAGRSTRTSENGWANRINDIFQDNIRITRNSDGKRGVLIEKAGSEMDASEVLSTMAKSIASMDIKIADMLELMASKEETYYNQFTRMESALSRMNSQFSSVFGSTGSAG